jgi:hypothetical protein
MPIVTSIVEPIVSSLVEPLTGSEAGEASAPGTMDFSKANNSGLLVLLEDI